MPDISCATFDTKEDKAMADEWAEKEAGNPVQLTPELQAELERIMPEVERAIEQRFDQMMEEKSTEFVERAEEIIEKGESDFSNLTPEDKELESALRTSLRPAETTPEERRAMREAGEELGLSPARYVGMADIVRLPKENVKEIMTILGHPEMPRSFVKRESIGQIQYVGIPQIPVLLGVKALTQTTNPELMMKQILELEDEGKMEEAREKGLPEERTLGIFIFPNEKGEVPTGKSLVEEVAHEVVSHGNWPRIREYIQEHKTDFDRAMAVQIREKGLPLYPLRQLAEDTEKILKAEKGEIPPLPDKEKIEIRGTLQGTKETRLLKETVAVISGFYFTEKSQLVPEAQKWFGDMLKHFRSY